MLVKSVINIALSFVNVVGEAIMVQTSKEKAEQTTNVSLYLSMTSLSSILSQYFGGYLLTIMTTNQLFLATSALPFINFLAAYFGREAKVQTIVRGRCSQAKKNLVMALKYLRLPTMYKPMIFIFIVVVAPGVTDAMFYYEANVLDFTSQDFGLLGVISSCSSIAAVWAYRLFFTKVALSWYFLVVTLALTCALLANLLIVNADGKAMTIAAVQ